MVAPVAVTAASVPCGLADFAAGSDAGDESPEAAVSVSLLAADALLLAASAGAADFEADACWPLAAWARRWFFASFWASCSNVRKSVVEEAVELGDEMPMKLSGLAEDWFGEMEERLDMRGSLVEDVPALRGDGGPTKLELRTVIRAQ